MKILKLNHLKFSQKYGCYLSSINQLISNDTIFSLTVIKVDKGKRSIAHKHFEKELLYVIEGQGLIDCGDVKAQIETGDFIFLDILKLHQIENVLHNKNLIILSIVWNSKVTEYNLIKNKKKKNSVELIISTPPTPNGNLHLGHLGGPYLRADIYKRYKKLYKREVLHICSSDDFQNYIVYQAAKEKKSKREIINYYDNLINNSFDSTNIKIDHYSNSYMNDTHIIQIQEKFKCIFQKGLIKVKNDEVLYCGDCSKHLYGAFIKGICFYCNRDTDGTICENCSTPNMSYKIIEPVCTCGTKSPLQKVVVPRLYFTLSNFEQSIKNYCDNIEVSNSIRSYMIRLFENKLEDYLISNISDWGIKVPLDTYSNQAIDVWFEMGLKFIYEIDKIKADQKEISSYTNFFGYDNIYFYTILFPGIFFALNMSNDLPKNLMMNHFLYLEEKKFSTSKNHVISIQTLINEAHVDYIRYYMASLNLSNDYCNFTISNFKNKIKDSIINQWIVWIRKLDYLLLNEFASIVPCIGLWNSNHTLLLTKIQNFELMIKQFYENRDFDLRNIIIEIDCFITFMNNFLQTNQELERVQHDYYRTFVSLQLAGLKKFALLISPIMPIFAEYIWCNLSNEEISFDQSLWVKEGQKVNLSDINTERFYLND